MVRTTIAVLALLTPSAHAAADPSTAVAADRVVVDRHGSVVAEGQVRLRRGRCRVEADRIELRRGRLVGCRLRLEPAGLRAARIEVDPGRLVAWQPRLRLCGCRPGSALTLSARRAWVERDGARLHLTQPLLRWGRWPLLALPYLALPLRRGVSGLLPPRIGASARDGLRLEQGGYAAFGRPGARADATVAAGWIQRRGTLLRAELRYLAGARGASALQLLAIQDRDRFRGWVRGGVGLHGVDWALAAQPQLVTDRQLLADLGDDVWELHAPYLRSRLWGQLRWGPLSLLGVGDLLRDSGAPWPEGPGTVGRATFQLELAPVAFVRPFALQGVAELHLVQAAESELGGLAAWVAPDLLAGARLGSLQALLRLGYRLRALTSGEAGGESVVAHALVVDAVAGFPLQRSFGAGRWSHRIEPLAGWRSVITGEGVDALADRLGRPQLPSGHYAVVGLRSSVAARGARRELLRVSTRLLHGVVGDHLLQAQLQLQLWRFRGQFEILHRIGGADGPATLQGRLCRELLGGLAFCAGYHRQRWSANPERLAGWHQLGLRSPAPWRHWMKDVDELELAPALRWRRLTARASIYYDPVRRELARGVLRARLRDRCGCLGLGITAQLWRGRRWPDLFFAVDYRPAAACLRQLIPRE